MSEYKTIAESNNFIVLDLSKKQSVFQKIAAFVEKFKGVGGKV